MVSYKYRSVLKLSNCWKLTTVQDFLEISKKMKQSSLLSAVSCICSFYGTFGTTLGFSFNADDTVMCIAVN